MSRTRLLIETIASLVMAVLLGILLAQSFGLSANCAPDNHQIRDPRLLSSTYLNLGQMLVPHPTMVLRHHVLYLPVGTSVVKLDERGQRIGGYQMPGQVFSIALDALGDLYATGSLNLSSRDAGFGAAANLGPQRRHYGKGGLDDAFVVKESPAGQVVWRTEMGGTNMDEGAALAVSNAGEVWVGGTTISDDFPLRHPIERHYHGPSLSHLPPKGAAFPEDAWIAQLDKDGKLDFSWYLGGSENDEVTMIGIDRIGQPVLYGWTASLDFAFTHRMLAPPRSPLGLSTSITFLVRLTRQGHLIAGTPIVHGEGSGGMVMDHSGDIYLLANDQVIKLDPSASHILYRTSLGRYAGPSAIALGAGDKVYVTGGTMTPTLRIASPLQARFHKHTCGSDETLHSCADAFVSVLDSRGRLMFGSYLGGIRDDGGEAIVTDRTGKAFILGTTNSPDFPLHHASACTIEGQVSYSGENGPTTSFLTVIKV